LELAASNESKIDTKLFAQTADTIANATKELNRLFSEWNKNMNSLRSVWQGDTSDDIKNTVEQVQKSSADLITALNGYPVALREIAGIYDNTEKNVQETGKTLKFEKAFR
jgi:WXG100 family type VII secretion target